MSSVGFFLHKALFSSFLFLQLTSTLCRHEPAHSQGVRARSFLRTKACAWADLRRHSRSDSRLRWCLSGQQQRA